MKWLQLTSSIGLITSILLYHVCVKRAILNTLLTSSSIYVHRNYPAKKEIILFVDRLLAWIYAGWNYYFGIIYTTHKPIYHLIGGTCLICWYLTRKSSSQITHTIVHLCWHTTSFCYILERSANWRFAK